MLSTLLVQRGHAYRASRAHWYTPVVCVPSSYDDSLERRPSTTESSKTSSAIHTSSWDSLECNYGQLPALAIISAASEHLPVVALTFEAAAQRFGAGH